jgi:hypothetical protein
MFSVNETVDMDPVLGNDQFMHFYIVYSLLIHRSSGKIAIIAIIPSTDKQV